jgi:hypothetical protein
MYRKFILLSSQLLASDICRHPTDRVRRVKAAAIRTPAGTVIRESPVPLLASLPWTRALDSWQQFRGEHITLTGSNSNSIMRAYICVQSTADHQEPADNGVPVRINCPFDPEYQL